MDRQALVVGASGIAGSAIAARLLEKGWSVHGLGRGPSQQNGVTPVVADLLDNGALGSRLASSHPSLIAVATWIRRDTEAEMVEINGRALRNLFAALPPARGLRHVALVTGLKHYLGPFENYGRGEIPPTPFREDQGRLDGANFYYAQEDAVFDAAARDGSTWSVHRPHTIIGKAVGNAMNMGTTLAVYASLCKALGRPFAFPGSPVQWHGLTDMTDAAVLADQVVWAASTPLAANEAFNVVNGDTFRWRWMWGRIAEWFEIEPAPFDGTIRPLQVQMADDAPVWRDLARSRGLAVHDLAALASPWHTDGDLGRPVEVVTDMSKSRKLGFAAYRATDDAFFDLFARLRADRIIP